MTITKTRFDLTAADTNIIGTDFQYFYFINAILSIKKGQSIGYEVKDDVHISLPCGSLVLIQVKHTTQRNVKAEFINLTEKDDDLWKTLNNWASVICDTNDGRNTLKEQVLFVEKTKFILATNKTKNSSNKFLAYLTKLKSKRISIDEFIDYLNKLSSKTKGDIKLYINKLLELNKNLLLDFMLKTELEFRADNIIDNIKNQIREKNIAENRINDVFNDIFSELKQDFFIKVVAGAKQIITFDEWYQKYTIIFENNRSTTLPIRKFQQVLPPDLKTQAFIEELIEIGDIDSNDVEQISWFTSFMLEIKLNLQEWHNDGEITLEQIERFHKNSVIHWRNEHKHYHRKTEKINDYEHALDCLDEVRKKELKIVNTELEIGISNGEFYHLSNEREIGWLKKWEDKYKKCKS